MFSSMLDVLRLKFERVYNVAWISSSNSSSILSIITELIVPKVTAGSPKWQKKDQTVTRGCPEPPCFGNGIVDDVARGPAQSRVGDRFGPHRALLILRSLDQKDPSGQVLNGPTLAKARERPDLKAYALPPTSEN
jgi:hypothetical protein